MRLLPTAVLASALIAMPGQAITTPYVDPVWRPFIMLAGDGDPVQAAERLQRIKQLQNTLVSNTRVDADTQRFVDGMWRSMERFDLKAFHGLLPEQEGRQRMLHVRGEWQDDVYHYTTVKQAEIAGIDAPLPLGDVRIRVAATHLQSLSHSNRFWLQGAVQVGVGASRWQTVRDAGAEILNMASYPPQRFVQLEADVEAEMRRQIRHAYPLLGNKDVAFLVPLWHAFPNLANLLVSIATVEDVVMEADNEQGYQSYSAQLVLNQDKLRSRYPALVRYLDKVDNLVESTIDISDANGRLLRVKVDSQQWRLQLETVLSFGGIVPLDSSGLRLDSIRHFRDEPVDLQVNIDSNLDVMGVRTQVRNLQAMLAYRPSSEKLSLETNINVVPTVSVDGAFLGAVPTGFIDMVIPGNIASIITEFFAVACEGNGGQGIVANVALQNTGTPGVSQASADGSVLAIDNPFIRMGMRIVNTRMIPDDAASEEWRHLFFATQDAFYQDFDLFMQKRKL